MRVDELMDRSGHEGNLHYSIIVQVGTVHVLPPPFSNIYYLKNNNNILYLRQKHHRLNNFPSLNIYDDNFKILINNFKC